MVNCKAPGLVQQWLNRTSGDVLDVSGQTDIFQKRYRYLLHQLAFEMHQSKQAGEGPYVPFMQKQSDLVQSVAIAYGESVIVGACDGLLADPTPPAHVKPILGEVLS